MANLSLSFLLLGTLMCQHSWAARKKMKVVASHAAGHDARSMDQLQKGGKMQQVEDFLKAVTEMGPQGQAAGALAKNLEDGVQDTIVSSEFNTGEDGSLTLEVVHSQVNQGEIATPSKVPVMWTLDPTTTYKFKFETVRTPTHTEKRWFLSVTGIKLLPFAEGREMYVESKVQEECATKIDDLFNYQDSFWDKEGVNRRTWVKEAVPSGWSNTRGLLHSEEPDLRSGSNLTTNELMAVRVKCEREALYQWYQGLYKYKYSKKDYLDYAIHPEHKLARALTSMYGSTSTYYAVKAGKAGAWSKIVYSLVTIAPIQIDQFVFLDNVRKGGPVDCHGEPDCFEKVEMAMVSHPALEGEYGGQDLAAFSGLDFYVKNGAEFDEKNFEKQRSHGEMFARSGMNFAAMAVKGKNQDILDRQRTTGFVRGGTAEYIINFAKPCRVTYGAANKNNDPTDECRGDKGRVFWH